MKKFLVLLPVLGLLVACDQSASGKQESVAGGDNAIDTKKSDWSSRERKEWLEECLETSGSTPGAKAICFCMLEKIESKYPDPKDAEEAGKEETDMLATECVISNDQYGLEDDANSIPADGNGSDENTDSSWTEEQRREFVHGCTTAAQHTQGFTWQQASQYCDCMTKRVEKSYSFQEASKLTAADFQTKEWSDESMDCRSRLEY